MSMDSYRYIFVIHLVGQKISIFNLVLFFHNPLIDIDHIIDRLGRMSSTTTSYLWSWPLPPINFSPHLSLSIVVVSTAKLMCSTTYLIVGKTIFFLLWSQSFYIYIHICLATTHPVSSPSPIVYLLLSPIFPIHNDEGTPFLSSVRRVPSHQDLHGRHDVPSSPACVFHISGKYCRHCKLWTP